MGGRRVLNLPWIEREEHADRATHLRGVLIQGPSRYQLLRHIPAQAQGRGFDLATIGAHGASGREAQASAADIRMLWPRTRRWRKRRCEPYHC